MGARGGGTGYCETYRPGCRVRHLCLHLLTPLPCPPSCGRPGPNRPPPPPPTCRPRPLHALHHYRPPPCRPRPLHALHHYRPPPPGSLLSPNSINMRGSRGSNGRGVEVLIGPRRILKPKNPAKASVPVSHRLSRWILEGCTRV